MGRPRRPNRILAGEAQHDGLLFETNGGAGLDGGDDGVAQGEDVGCGGAAAVDDGEDVLGGEAGAAHGEAFAEAGEFDEPGSGELDHVAGGWEVRAGGKLGDLIGVTVGDGCEAGNFCSRHDGILEEGAGRARVGIVDGEPAVVLEHVTRLREDLCPDWPQPAQPGGSYRIEITGEPSYGVDVCLSSRKGDHNHAGLVATAMRVVNAIPAVVAAPAGIRTTLDLPLVTGRGLYSTG